MKSISKIAVGALLVITSFLFSTSFMSCGEKKTEPSEPFVIGFNEWVGFAPFYLAKEKGYFDGLEVSLNFIDLEGDKRAGLYSGRLQMICETMDMFQTNRDKTDFPGVIVFAIDESFGGDGVVASADVKSIRDLKGKKVVSEPGLPAHFVLQYLLHQEGMTMEDMELQDMTSSDAAAAFIAGRSDVAGTYEPYLSTALEKREGAHLLASTADLPGLIIDVAIVSGETLEKRKSDVRKVYKGWCQAIQDLEQHEAEAVAIMAKAFNLTSEEFNDTRSGLRYFNRSENERLFGTPSNLGQIFDTFDEVGNVLLENGLTEVTVSAVDKIKISVVTGQ